MAKLTKYNCRSFKKYNFPFILSTVSTSDIETISKITDGEAWFQLYYPSNKTIRYDILKRAEDSGCPVLVLLCDVPSFGYRPKILKWPCNASKNVIEQHASNFKMSKWALKTLYYGKPNFETLKTYMKGKMNLQQLENL